MTRGLKNLCGPCLTDCNADHGCDFTRRRLKWLSYLREPGQSYSDVIPALANAE